VKLPFKKWKSQQESPYQTIFDQKGILLFKKIEIKQSINENIFKKDGE
jgi:hypothetical protein